MDTTLTYTMPGEYEVIDADFQPDAVNPGSNGSLSGQPSQGTATLKLGPYNPAIMYTTSDITAAGWETVPGSAPGNQGNYTEIPLADGSAYFFTGGCAGGQVVQLPALGINPANFMGWVSPEGHIDGSEHLHFIQQCDIDANRKTSMIYSSDVGVTWTGDVNYAGLAWSSRQSANVTTLGPMTYVELTLAGGEKVIFGRGMVADGTTIPLPSAYSPVGAFMFAYMRDGVNTDHPAHGMRAYVDSNQVAQKMPLYFPQKTTGHRTYSHMSPGYSSNYGKVVGPGKPNTDGTRYPRSVIMFPSVNGRDRGSHPTQKPVALCDYLIRTYTEPGMTVWTAAWDLDQPAWPRFRQAVPSSASSS